jgi:hypothetical protein
VVNLAMFIAQGGDITTDLVPLYYAIGILGLIVGGLFTLKRYAASQRQRDVQQGIREGQLADNLAANTKAADKNTASIEKLGEKFDTFAAAIDKRLTLVDYRVDKLEEKIQGNGSLRSHTRKDEDSV